MATQPSRGEHPRSVTVIASLTNGSSWTRPLGSKVPETSATFWSLTFLATAVGETGADYLSHHSGLGLPATTATMGLLLTGVLICQVSSSRCLPGWYWPATILASVVATLLSKDLIGIPGMSVWTVTATVAAVLVASLTGWYIAERTVSIHSVLNRRREVWFWGTVLCIFALGASVEDLVLGKLGLGHASEVLVLSVLVGVIALAYAERKRNAVLAFWGAYAVVQPLGGVIGHSLTATSRSGGLGRGASTTSACLLALIVVVYGVSTTGRHRSHQKLHLPSG